jgi:hypothetical protein
MYLELRNEMMEFVFLDADCIEPDAPTICVEHIRNSAIIDRFSLVDLKKDEWLKMDYAGIILTNFTLVKWSLLNL